jgi:hypothetical protein
VHQSVPTVLLCAAKPVEKWSDVFNLSTNLIEEWGSEMATESKSKMNLGSWMQPSVDADGNPLKKAPAKPPKKDKVFSKAQANQI